MPNSRSHRFALPLTLAVLALVLTACGGGVAYPNSTFNSTTEVNDLSTHLWDKLLFWGTVVFVIVEAILLYTIIRYRRKDGAPDPEQVHGNTALEITWTVIPVLILALIAVPTVETIFKTQAKAPADALEVEVIGHQWWWEFRYPSLGVTTANELYLPAGKTVNFSLQTKDVLHSFWVPQLGGKRDLISNHTNHIWYTPKDSLAMSVFNGFCVEYCGASHANMRFRAYVVSPTDFEAWAAHNADMAMMRDPEPAAAPAATAPAAKP
ncbi:MAG: cytochrome c oxidase subunit II, partial [Gemmatimonadaceae bacterium]|nr:cytochrome c oxidase subunit II [Gemmatimonadaceae bacterium]